MWGFWGTRWVQQRSGTLELRYCTTSFTQRFSPWSLPRHCGWDGKRWSISTAQVRGERSTDVKKF